MDDTVRGAQTIVGRATETGDSFNELGTMTDMFSKEQLFQHKWTTTPEVSGLMYLSPMM